MWGVIKMIAPFGIFDDIVGFAAIMGGLVSGVFILGFAEIIQLLQKIYNKKY